jgi:hypothetical protein
MKDQFGASARERIEAFGSTDGADIPEQRRPTYSQQFHERST